jgi:hypothetical protein
MTSRHLGLKKSPSVIYDRSACRTKEDGRSCGSQEATSSYRWLVIMLDQRSRLWKQMPVHYLGLMSSSLVKDFRPSCSLLFSIDDRLLSGTTVKKSTLGVVHSSTWRNKDVVSSSFREKKTERELAGAAWGDTELVKCGIFPPYRQPTSSQTCRVHVVWHRCLGLGGVEQCF